MKPWRKQSPSEISSIYILFGSLSWQLILSKELSAVSCMYQNQRSRSWKIPTCLLRCFALRVPRVWTIALLFSGRLLPGNREAENQWAEFEIIPLSGHTIGQIGVLTPIECFLGRFDSAHIQLRIIGYHISWHWESIKTMHSLLNRCWLFVIGHDEGSSPEKNCSFGEEKPCKYWSSVHKFWNLEQPLTREELWNTSRSKWSCVKLDGVPFNFFHCFRFS